MEVTKAMELLAKKVRSTNGEMYIDVPRLREESFGPIILEKRENDIPYIEYRILKMYARYEPSDIA